MRKIKTILVLIGIGMLFLVSEAVYVYKHSDVFLTYILRTVRIASTIGRIDVAFFILSKAAVVVNVQNHNDYWVFFKEDFYPTSFSNDGQFKSHLEEYFNTFSDDNFSLGRYDLARVYYDLAILAFKNGQEALTPKLLNTAIKLSPNSSFWSVELANYYLYNNQPDMAKKILDRCTSLVWPRQHCQEYLNGSFTNDQPESVGFLDNEVKRFYILKFP